MTFFFGLHLILGGKLDVGTLDDLIFLVFTGFWEENWTSEHLMTLFFWSSPDFGRKIGRRNT